MQSKSSALVASLVLGVIWGWWHLPLFFVKGTSQADVVGFGTLGFWLYLIQVIALSVIFTWVYNNNRRSILSAVLLHFMDNTTFSLLTPEGTVVSDQTEIIATVLYVAAAVLIVAFWGAKSMTRPQKLSSAESG